VRALVKAASIVKRSKINSMEGASSSIIDIFDKAMMELGEEKVQEQEEAAVVKKYIPLRLGAKSAHDIAKALAGPSKPSGGGNTFIRAWGKKAKQADCRASPGVSLLAKAKAATAMEKSMQTGVEGELASLKTEVQQNHRVALERLVQLDEAMRTMFSTMCAKLDEVQQATTSPPTILKQKRSVKVGTHNKSSPMRLARSPSSPAGLVAKRDFYDNSRTSTPTPISPRATPLASAAPPRTAGTQCDDEADEPATLREHFEA